MYRRPAGSGEKFLRRSGVDAVKTFISHWLLVAVTVAPASLAHHSVPVNFDQSTEIAVEGVLTEIKWLNPHSHFRMDVIDESGETVEWLVEMGSVNAMRRTGFETDVFDLGDSVLVIGYPGRRDRVIFLNRALVGNGANERCVASPGRDATVPCEPRSTL